MSLIRTTLQGAGLGSIILTDCYLRMIDFSSMENVWAPSLKAAMAMNASNPDPQITSEAVPSIVEALKAMPSAIHAHYLSRDSMLWSSLQPANLTIPITDLTLKYGGMVSGSWSVVYILDTWADTGESPDVSSVWSSGQLMDTVLMGVHGLRTIMGRPSTWVGITPLMIFRDTAGWNPSSSTS